MDSLRRRDNYHDFMVYSTDEWMPSDHCNSIETLKRHVKQSLGVLQRSLIFPGPVYDPPRHTSGAFGLQRSPIPAHTLASICWTKFARTGSLECIEDDWRSSSFCCAPGPRQQRAVIIVRRTVPFLSLLSEKASALPVTEVTLTATGL